MLRRLLLQFPSECPHGLHARYRNVAPRLPVCHDRGGVATELYEEVSVVESNASTFAPKEDSHVEKYEGPGYRPGGRRSAARICSGVRQFEVGLAGHSGQCDCNTRL